MPYLPGTPDRYWRCHGEQDGQEQTLSDCSFIESCDPWTIVSDLFNFFSNVLFHIMNKCSRSKNYNVEDELNSGPGFMPPSTESPKLLPQDVISEYDQAPPLLETSVVRGPTDIPVTWAMVKTRVGLSVWAEPCEKVWESIVQSAFQCRIWNSWMAWWQRSRPWRHFPKVRSKAKASRPKHRLSLEDDALKTCTHPIRLCTATLPAFIIVASSFPYSGKFVLMWCK